MSRSRGGAALVLLVAYVVSSAGGTAQADGTAPATYDVSATAVGIALQSTQQPAASVVTAGLVDTTAAYSSSALSAYGPAARNPDPSLIPLLGTPHSWICAIWRSVAAPW